MVKTVIPVQPERGPRTIPEGTGPSSGEPIDRLGRALRDLRVSVTDRCNFRCTYCMPREVFGEDYPFLPRAEVLTFEDITRVTRAFHGLGTAKVRLTGGEPLLRRGVERLVAMLREAIPSLDLTLTTNGSALKAHARALKRAGLDRVTVSLDSLEEATFRRMNDADFPVAKVLEGIDAAAAAGLSPIKVNMVVRRGVNDAQVVDMARHFRGTGHILRFIEFMDVGTTNGWRMDEVVPSVEVLRRLSEHFGLEPAEANYGGEVAERWRYLDGAGEIGVISSVTRAFCATCTRARLSTDGQLYTCLFGSRGYDLRALLREGRDDAALRDAIRAIWQRRDDRYSEVRSAAIPKPRKVEMSYIGG